MADPLADVILKARARCREWDLDGYIAAAVRAAGYKSPEEIAAVLDAERDKWNLALSDRDALRREGAIGTVESIEAALLGDDRG